MQLAGELRRLCSQMRSTHQSSARSRRLICLSRSMLRVSFRFQKAARTSGMVPCDGQQCQKQPSTKTTTRSFRKTKSGAHRTVPSSLGTRARARGFRRRMVRWRLQPVMPATRNARQKVVSVVRLPRLLTAFITCDRCFCEKTSAIGRVPGATW